MWTCLAAMILLFFGMFIILFTCFSAWKTKKANHQGGRHKTSYEGATYDNGVNNGDGYATTTTRRTRKKKFGIF